MRLTPIWEGSTLSGEKKGAAFLRTLREADAQHRTLEIFADDADGFGAAVLEDIEAFGHAIRSVASQPSAAPADFMPGAYVTAALRKDGSVVADGGLAEALGQSELAAAITDLRNKASSALLVCDRSGRPVAITAASWADARGWPLPAAVRAAGESGRAGLLVLGFRPDTRAWRRAGETLGLTNAEARLVEALGRSGDLRQASRTVGLTYESARTLLASCLKKTGCSRQTDLIRLALSLTAGEVRPPEQAGKLFAELFGLTLSQANLARALARGATRSTAAAALGISEHRAKSELKSIFLACGVTAAPDLARLVAEVEALSGLAHACDVQTRADEHLRLVKRRWSDGRICFADHGPSDGAPVIVFHTSTGGRTHSPRFMAAARAAGLRMIAIERPGYGLTDPADGSPFAAAARDVEDVMDALQTPQALILARGGATAALAAARRLGPRITGGVLLGPDPPADLDHMRTGMMGWGKKVLFDNPHLAEAFAKMLSRRTGSEAIAKLMKQSVRGSEPDEAALRDPEELAALVRGGRQSAIGLWGFLREHLAHGSGVRPLPMDARNWVLLAGRQDPLYHFEDAETFWRDTLTGLDIETVSDGGRFLHITHAALVINALRRCASNSETA